MGRQVFIVYEKDGYGGICVDKVFSDEQSAVDYVIKNVFGSNEFYAYRTRIENEQAAKEHIERHYMEE